MVLFKIQKKLLTKGNIAAVKNKVNKLIVKREIKELKRNTDWSDR